MIKRLVSSKKGNLRNTKEKSGGSKIENFQANILHNVYKLLTCYFLAFFLMFSIPIFCGNIEVEHDSLQYMSPEEIENSNVLEYEETRENTEELRNIILLEDKQNVIKDICIIVSALLVVYVIYQIVRGRNNLKDCGRSILRMILIWFYVVIGLVSYAFYIENDLAYFFIPLIPFAVMVGIVYLDSLNYRDDYVKLTHNIDEPCKTYELLFPQRKRQANRIGKLLEINKEVEHFSILIKSSWGSGKTSLINGLRDGLETNKITHSFEYDFIFISAGFTCNSKKLIKEIENQLISVFEEHDFFHGLNNDLKDYFKFMAGFASIATNGRTDFFADIISEKMALEDARIRVNKLLDTYYLKLGRKIVIVIDDLERCPIEYRKNVFSLMMETTRLNNCVTVLLTDYEQLIDTNRLTRAFINKYFDETINLLRIGYDDLIDKYALGKHFIDVDSELHNEKINDVETLRKNCLYYGKAIYDYALANRNVVIFGQDTLDKMDNARNINRMWNKGIKFYATQLIELYQSDNDENDMKQFDSNESEWPKIITWTCMLEYIWSEEYDTIIQCGSFDKYEDYCNSLGKTALNGWSIINSILNIKANFHDYRMLEWMIFSLDKQVKIIKSTSVSEEWIFNELAPNHMKEYLENYTDTCGDITKLVSFMNDNLRSFDYELLEGVCKKVLDCDYTEADYIEDMIFMHSAITKLLKEEFEIVSTPKEKIEVGTLHGSLGKCIEDEIENAFKTDVLEVAKIISPEYLKKELPNTFNEPINKILDKMSRCWAEEGFYYNKKDKALDKPWRYTRLKFDEFKKIIEAAIKQAKDVAFVNGRTDYNQVVDDTAPYLNNIKMCIDIVHVWEEAEKKEKVV